MRKGLLLLLLVAKTFPGLTQSDLLVLKHRNQIIQTWMAGSFISFQFSSKQWLQGNIKDIRNDSVILDQVIIRQVANRFGFPTLDTAHMGILKLHVNEMYAMPKRNLSNDIFSNGVLLKLGGGAYILLNLINSLKYHEQVFSAQNLTGIGIAAGVFLVGSLLQASHKTYVILGKKYTMATIHTGRAKTN